MSTCVNFFYKDSTRDLQKEAVITAFTSLACQVISLPDIVEVCIYKLPDNVHGGVDKKVNRLVINSNLLLEDTTKILAHELIHVSQKHEGTLRITQDGVCYWRTIPYQKKLPEDMPYDEYMNLPWEVDVQNRQENLINQVLELYNKA
jgi:predicted metallopeptidase